MSEKPFSSVSMSDIAERVGMSKGAVYWHFKNKNDVLINLIETILDEKVLGFSQISSLPDGFSGLKRFFRMKISSLADGDRAQMVNMLMHRLHEWPEEVARSMTDSIHDMTKRELEMLTELVTRAQERREIRDDIPANDIAGMVSAIFYGMMFLRIHGIHEMDFAGYTDFILSVLEREFSFGGKIVPFGENLKQLEMKETVQR
jgi:TetR/AcrR family acrAB operon transcriptional repressor